MNVTLHPQGDASTDIYPNVPVTLAFAYNLVVNSKGAQFGGANSGYQWNDLSEWGVYPDYDVKGLCYRDEIVQDKDVFKQYMTFMTGSDYLPEYNANEPRDTYIYLSSGSYDVNSKVWKLQHTQVEFQGQNFNVLLAFKVKQFPFALKEEIPTVSPYPYVESNGGTVDTDNNRVVFELDTNLLENGISVTAQILLKDNNDNEGTMFVNFMRVDNSFEPIFENKTGIAEHVSPNYEYDYSSQKFYIRLVPDGQSITINDIHFTMWNVTLFAHSAIQ